MFGKKVLFPEAGAAETRLFAGLGMFRVLLMLLGMDCRRTKPVVELTRKLAPFVKSLGPATPAVPGLSP